MNVKNNEIYRFKNGIQRNISQIIMESFGYFPWVKALEDKINT